MRNNIEQFVDFALTIAIIFFVPLIYFGQKKDILIQTLVSERTISFGNEIRSQGYLSNEMYDSFLMDLSTTGLLYEVDLEHRHSVYEPEYRIRTPEEIIEDQDKSYNGGNVYTYRPVTTEIPIVNDPVNNGSLNTETNESVLAKAVNNPASPSHMHTEACYNGTKHIHTGNSSSGGGCYGQYNSGGTCGRTVTNAGSYSLPNITDRCSNAYCNGTVTASQIVIYFECFLKHRTSIHWRRIVCNKEGTLVIDEPSFPNSCRSSETYYSLNCGKTEGAYYNGNTQVFPICNQIITSIIATHPVQTVALGDLIITTITANYLDGSTKVVVASTTFSTNSVVQNAQATLTYTYNIAGTSYSKSCNITVTVIPRSKTCINGHTYNLKTDGSDPGCPYCKSWLRSLSIVDPASGSMTIYKGTTLSENGVTLLATYMDGHTEYLYNEYVDNLDMQYVGTQNVTLSYKGKYVYLSVTSKRNLIKCSTCSRYYELYPDGSDPGCPYCLSKTPIFTGNVLQYETEYFNNEIQKELYEGRGIYYFSDRDSISINVKNSKSSLSQNLLQHIFKGLQKTNIQIVDSGYIRENGSTTN